MCFQPSFKRGIIARQARRAGKMQGILCSDWLPQRANWSDTAHSGLPVFFPQKNCTEVQVSA